MKYHPSRRFAIQSLARLGPALALPTSHSSTFLESAFSALVNCSVAKSTWGKYSSAYNAFSCFEAYSCLSFPWPLSRESIRAFAVWCSAARGLQPSTT